MARRYDSTRRKAQARATRRRIIAAASELFVDKGYAATSIAAVADAAGVAPQTVHTAFGSKSRLLGEAVDTALTGDDEPVAVIDRPELRAALTHTDPDAAARSFARAATAVLRRAGRLIHAADAAAASDEDLDALCRAGHRARLEDMRTTAAAFQSAGILRRGISPDAAADLMWLLASPDAFHSCTVHRGWSPSRFEGWLADTLRGTVLGRAEPHADY